MELFRIAVTNLRNTYLGSCKYVTNLELLRYLVSTYLNAFCR